MLSFLLAAAGAVATVQGIRLLFRGDRLGELGGMVLAPAGVVGLFLGLARAIG